MNNRISRRVWFVTSILLVIYVAAYFALSRRGYVEARRQHLDGFFYVSPFTKRVWYSLNRVCRVVFWPLNKLDCLTGNGMSPACDPLMGLD